MTDATHATDDEVDDALALSIQYRVCKVAEAVLRDDHDAALDLLGTFPDATMALMAFSMAMLKEIAFCNGVAPETFIAQTLLDIEAAASHAGVDLEDLSTE